MFKHYLPHGRAVVVGFDFAGLDNLPPVRAVSGSFRDFRFRKYSVLRYTEHEGVRKSEFCEIGKDDIIIMSTIEMSFWHKEIHGCRLVSLGALIFYSYWPLGRSDGSARMFAVECSCWLLRSCGPGKLWPEKANEKKSLIIFVVTYK